jgi:acyl carrier protein
MAKELIEELKVLLIEGLHLEEIAPADIDPQAPLFGEGLGLDSIDALEIGVMLDRQYGIKLVSDDEKNNQIFASLQSLTDFVAEKRTQ